MAHLRQLPSKRWRWIVKRHGVQRTGSADTKGEAKMAAAEAELELGRVPRGVNATLHELLTAHLAAQGYTPNVHNDLVRIVCMVPDDVLAWRIQQIEPVQVEALYRRLPWAPNTLRRFHMLLGSAFTRAVSYGWVNPSPIKSVRAPKVPKKRVQPPTLEQVRIMLAAAEPTVALFLRLAATTGARRSELCALQWGDVDLDTGTVIIRRAISNTRDGLLVHDGKTGTAGHRVIGIDPATVALLAAHKAHQEGLTAASATPPGLWLFSHDAGQTPWRGDFISRRFRQIRDTAGLTDLKLHGLRHHVATLMLAQGEAVTNVSNRLGHRSSATTLAVYAHYVPASDRAAADRLAGALDD